MKRKEAKPTKINRSERSERRKKSNQNLMLALHKNRCLQNKRPHETVLSENCADALNGI